MHTVSPCRAETRGRDGSSHLSQLLQIMDVCIVYTDACRLGLREMVLLAKACRPSSGYTCSYSVAEPRQVVL